MGSCEQPLRAAAAGMALGGDIPSATDYGVFLLGRAMDQLRVSVCYTHLNVKLGGAHAGVSVGADGATHKTLVRLHDGSLVESVLMAYRDRVTVCISSQAGCGMNCPFCATGQEGLTRNLSTAEIVEQVVAAGRSALELEPGP